MHASNVLNNNIIIMLFPSAFLFFILRVNSTFSLVLFVIHGMEMAYEWNTLKRTIDAEVANNAYLKIEAQNEHINSKIVPPRTLNKGNLPPRANNSRNNQTSKLN